MPLTRRPRLLVIDDEPSVLDIVCELLTVLGYDVEGAANGPEGLALLARKSFDLVLTDLRMPILTGWDVVETVRQTAPRVPVILVTGTATDQDVDRARACGVPLIPKPVQLAELEAVVRETLAP